MMPVGGRGDGEPGVGVLGTGKQAVVVSGSVAAPGGKGDAAHVQGMAPPVSIVRSLGVYYRILLGRSMAGRGRLVVLVALSMLPVLVAVLLRNQGVAEASRVDVVSQLCLSLVLPLAAVLVAIPTLGSVIEGNLLVYLLLKPIPRWCLAVAAIAVALTLLTPVVITTMVTAAIAGDSSLVAYSGLAALLGALAYGALFVTIGARFSAGVWFALGYVFVWERVVAGISDGSARLSLQSSLFSLLQRGTDTVVPLADRSFSYAISAPLVVTAMSVLATSLVLSRRDIG